jgi:RNA polymerase sigma-70 factor (ECF subfamily)
MTVASSETQTFGEIYAAHFADLTVQLYAYFGDRHEAQDVVQEAFCRAFARWGKISRYDDPVAWIRRVAWNLAVSRWRRARTAAALIRRRRPAEDVIEGPDPGRVALVTALAALPATQRRSLIMHYLGDFTVSEIADREGVPPNTVKSWIHRGRAAVVAQLGLEETGVEEVRRD